MDFTTLLPSPASSYSTYGPVALFVALALLWLLLLAPSRAQRAVAHLPRPRTALPLLGDTLTVLSRHRRTMHTWLLDECLRLRGAPFVVDVVSKPPMVVLSSVAAIEDVLKREADAFVKGDEFTQALGDLFGRGIFVTDGAAWHAQRKAASLLFAPHMVRDIMDAVMVRKTETLVELLADTAARGARVDAKHLFELFASDVFTIVGFGVDLDFMRRDTPENAEFFERFGRANHNTLFRQQQPRAAWKLLRALNLGQERLHREDVAWLDRFVYRLITDSMQRKQQQEQLPSDGRPRYDVISLLLQSREDGATPDVAEIRDMAMAFISAGRDTTAYSMTWFLIMMAQHPHVQTQIRAELRAKLPALFTGELTAPSKDRTADLVLLEAAIKENLRLNTIIPANTRESTRDVTLRDGTFLAAGTKVILPAYAMARLPWVWGDDAAQFKPERWIEPETGKLRTISPFQFLTFSAGPRICPGKQFSIMEMKIALAALLSKFEITTEKDPSAFVYDTSLALGVEGPVYICPTLLATSN